VALIAAKLVPRGSVVGVDIWRADQTGKSMEATRANAEAEGVTDRVELHTRDMTDLELPDGSFDLVVSNLAIHNLPDDDARRSAIDEAVRVLRPGGGWRAWWGLPFFRTHAVTATKPGP
jgi:ubiquinone/menaquinone biosynthesis C-methylase UbiE